MYELNRDFSLKSFSLRCKLLLTFIRAVGRYHGHTYIIMNISEREDINTTTSVLNCGGGRCTPTLHNAVDDTL